MSFNDTIKPFLSNLLKQVMQEAMNDEIISPEESVLLSQIELDVRAFEKELANCIEEEGGIPEAFSKECFKEKIISNVKKLALEDGKISKDEESILSKLEEYFSE